MRTTTAAPFPEGCQLPPEQCDQVAQVAAGARHYEATANEVAPTSALAAVVLALAGCFLVLSLMTERNRRTANKKGSHR